MNEPSSDELESPASEPSVEEGAASEQTAAVSETQSEAAAPPVGPATKSAAAPEAKPEAVPEPETPSPPVQPRPRPVPIPSPRSPWGQAPISVGHTLYAVGLVLLVPVLLALGAQLYLSRMQRVFDGQLLLPDGNIDMVTALQWSTEPDGPLFVGTRADGVFGISRDGSVSQLRTFGEVDPQPILRATNPVVAFHASGEPVPLFLVRDNAGSDDFVASQIQGGGLFAVQGDLFAAVPANNGSAVVGRYPEQKGPGPPPPGTPRHLVLFRELNTGTATEVSEIFGIEDVRAVAALPGTDIVIAGDGRGGVFAIDAAQQISGVNPDQYIRRIGGHETAIVEIAASAVPTASGAVFATLADDRTIKIWRAAPDGGGPLGAYAPFDVSLPGSAWIEEPALPQVEGLSELLSMSRDGRRLLANRGTDLVIYDLPMPGERATATVHQNISHDSLDSPAILSPDGTRLLAANTTDVTIELLDLSTIGNGERPLPVVDTFLLERPVAKLEFDAAGQRFLAVGTDGTIFIQPVASDDGMPITISDYFGQKLEAAISPDGMLVAVCGSSGGINFHSTVNGELLSLIEEACRTSIPGVPALPTFDADGRKLHVYEGLTTVLTTYSIRGLSRRAFAAARSIETPGFKITPHGRRYMATFDGELHVGDINGQTELATLPLRFDATQWVSDFTARRIAVLDGEAQVRLFRETEDRTRAGPMPALRDGALHLSADGSSLFVGAASGDVLFSSLNFGTSMLIRPLLDRILDGPVPQFEAGSYGSSVMSARADGTVSVSEINFQVISATAELTNEQAVVRPQSLYEVAVITGHGSPIQAMALSPDGSLLATASLDGRLRITDLAMARLVHLLPFSALPAGPAVETMVARQLDNSPYEPAVGEGPPARLDFVAVYGAQRDLPSAQAVNQRALDAGLPDARIYLRQGFFRNVVAFETAEQRDAALPRIRALSSSASSAYARQLSAWCPYAAPRGGYLECLASPPAAAN